MQSRASPDGHAPSPFSSCLQCCPALLAWALPGSQCSPQAGLQRWLHSCRVPLPLSRGHCGLCFRHLVISVAHEPCPKDSCPDHLSVPLFPGPFPPSCGSLCFWGWWDRDTLCCVAVHGQHMGWPQQRDAFIFSPGKPPLPFHSACSLSLCIEKLLPAIPPLVQRPLCLLTLPETWLVLPGEAGPRNGVGSFLCTSYFSFQRWA